MKEYCAKRGNFQVFQGEIRTKVGREDGKIDLEWNCPDRSQRIIAQALVAEIHEYLEKHDQRDEKKKRVCTGTDMQWNEKYERGPARSKSSSHE